MSQTNYIQAHTVTSTPLVHSGLACDHFIILQVTRPDGQKESCGLTILDEPSAKQTNPTVLDLQLRATAKQTAVKPVTIHSITDPEKQTKMLDSWINSIR